jgi:hypothetical protein
VSIPEQINNASGVRYIKLGAGNAHAEHCINEGKIILGFWTYLPEMFNACLNKDWKSVEEIIRQQRTLGNGGREPRSVVNDLRQVKEFFDDDGSIIWITFHNRKMYWGLGTPVAAEFVEVKEIGHEKLCLRNMSFPWSNFNFNGDPLLMDDIAGNIAMTSQYQGTICKIDDVNYIKRRIRGENSEIYVQTKNAIDNLLDDIADGLKKLNPRDFELLVEMIFVNTGWRRVGFSGGTEELVDMILTRPSLVDHTNEVVAVQVKSTTNQREYEKYEKAIGATYKNAFYVYHTGRISRIESGQMKLLDAISLAPLILKTGLTDWLLERIK